MDQPSVAGSRQAHSFATPDDEEPEVLEGVGVPLVRIRPASGETFEVRGRHSRGASKDLEPIDEYASSRYYPDTAFTREASARRRSPQPTVASSLFRKISTLRSPASPIFRNRSARKALGRYNEIGDDYDVDSVPVDLSSLAGMGFEPMETPRITIEDTGNRFPDQHTAYISPASTSSKPGFASFAKKPPTLGDGLVVGAEFKFDPSKATPDRTKSSSSRHGDDIQRSRTVRQIGQTLAESKQTIVAVKEKIDESEAFDLSSYEGSKLDYRMSSQTLDASSRRSHNSPQTMALSYFFPEDPAIPNWRPFSMSTWYISLLIGLSLGLAIFQEWLCQRSLRLAKEDPPHGILEFNEVSQVSIGAFFSWKYLPTMITIFYAVLVSIMDFDIRRLEPYHHLARPQGSLASHSLNLDHLTVFQYFVPLRAAQFKQWAVFFSTIANIVASTIAPSLQNPSVGFLQNPNCNADGSNCQNSDQQKMYFVRISPIWSRALEASLVLTAIVLTIILVILVRRKSGLQSDPKGIAGIAAMATKSHILHDFHDLDLASRAQIHSRLAHRRFILYKSSIWQGQYDRTNEPRPRGDMKNPHPFMLQLRFGIPFIVVLFLVLGAIPVISFTPARIIPNDAPWLPIALATVLKMIWTTLESDVRLIEPFYRLSKGNATPQESLTLDYQGTVYGWMPIRALLNKHYLLMLVGITSVMLDVLTVTISSFSVNSQVFLLQSTPKSSDNSNQDETRVSFFTSVVLSMTITVFAIVTACLVYLRRRHPFLPREPSTIAAILAFIHASKMLDDFVGTEHLSNSAMEERLKGFGKRYALGWFKGRDGRVHCAIDEEPVRSRYVHGVSYREAQAPWEHEEGLGG